MDLFAPATLGPVRLRNRVLKAATYEGMSPGGVASRALVDFHRRLAAGGVGMTTVAYCAVSEAARTFGDQLWLRPESHAALRDLTRAVHDEGGAASLQLAHAGMFSKLRGPDGRAPRGPSRAFNAYGVSAGCPSRTRWRRGISRRRSTTSAAPRRPRPRSGSTRSSSTSVTAIS